MSHMSANIFSSTAFVNMTLKRRILKLCVPQIFSQVLHDFQIPQINAVIDEMHIYCSRCNPAQLAELKASGTIPPGAPLCGLMTKTDAERLCAALLRAAPPRFKPRPGTERDRGVRVVHACFGKARGVLYPALYAAPDAACVECLDCGGAMSPRHFVTHAHAGRETQTVHWGFDSARWREYLALAPDQVADARMQAVLDDVKAKFAHAEPAQSTVVVGGGGAGAGAPSASIVVVGGGGGGGFHSKRKHGDVWVSLSIIAFPRKETDNN
ncbi:unnamed protein product [Notodromas monacha]|uniref:c-SKI SMAD4-binding domain-containing protein n=1 Tax=Notodromas monacha TaxID=399045 RepID=A0A7R9BLC3_9CRUS|nr:unnamed protein product [Notodromas monacha]CAG0916257.1 unnamed protein product [Notodromas monacha]